MINGVHALMYSESAAATRKFFRDVLGYPSVDAGYGWLIFALPPAELAAHPIMKGEGTKTELYFMCDDLEKTMAELKSKGIGFVGKVSKRSYGNSARMIVPGAGEVGLYEPKHPIAAGMKMKKQTAKKAAKKSGKKK